MGFLDRIVAPFRGRSYDGAQGGRRWRGQPSMPAPQLAAQVARRPLADRARYAVSNNPLAASGVEAWVTSLVGTGMRMQSKHHDQATREAIAAAWEKWTDIADADDASDFYGMQASAVRQMVVTGNGLLLMLNTPAGLRLRLIDFDQVDTSYTTPLSGGAQVVQGIEIDADGKRLAFHLFRERPGQVYSGFQRERMRIPAEDVILLHRPLWPGALTGISWFAPILLRLNDHDGTRDATSMRMRVGAMFTGWIRNGDGTASPFEGEQVGSTLTSGLTPGMMQYLNPNESVEFSDPPTIGMDSIAFMRLTERELAVGLGVPPYLLHGDISDVNYSSIRASLISFREKCSLIQHSVLVYQLLRRVFARWVTLEVLSGRISATVDEAQASAWVSERQAWVDPLKDCESEILAINNGLKSRREAVASRGRDVEELDAEIAADRAREKSLGLTFALPTPANSNEPPAQAAA